MKTIIRTLTSLLLLVVLNPMPQASAQKSVASEGAALFVGKVRPLIQKKCVGCHNAKDRSGGLDLSGDASVAAKGANGPTWTPGDPDKSRLFQRVSAREMPPNGPLSAQEIDLLRQWITAGAVWKNAGTAKATASAEPKRAGLDWWSLQPPHKSPLPPVKAHNWVRNPIDTFILAKLEANGLHSAPPADSRTLIRRVTYDLLGVPPTPEEIRAFVNNRAPDAYEKLVDRLLADPRYGERWARHWLDTARFSESQGFERDVIRDNAWPYRDYVIDSLNADKPYNRFVQEQIAGDVLPDGGGAGVIATGFLVAGPFDEAGSGSASALLRAQVREEELEDMLSCVGQTFLGLTVNCARCHDHKFDPILQRDYYRLKSALEGVHGGNRPFYSGDPSTLEASRKQLRERSDTLASEILALKFGKDARTVLWNVPDVPAPFARWSFQGDARDAFGRMPGMLKGGATIVGDHLHLNGNGAYLETATLPTDILARTLEAWVILPNRDQGGGGVLSLQTPDGQQFDAVVYGEREPKKWVAGSNFYQRTHDLDAPQENAPPDAMIHVAIVYGTDNRITFYRNGVPYGSSYVPDGTNGTLRTFPAKGAQLLMGLRHTGAGRGYLEGDIVEARLYDRPLSAEQVLASYRAGVRKAAAATLRTLTPEETQQLARLEAEQKDLDARQETLNRPTVTYAATSQTPAPTFVLLRGDVQSHGELVSAGGIAALKSVPADFGLAPDAPEGDRRLRLAAWIANPNNPLTARVLVNRVWHYHFGHGIVGTPNDFGFNGEKPTNQPLLDWLACTFMEPSAQGSYGCNGHLKALHRLIVLSSTYRQSSQVNPKAMAVDADNRWLWRFAPRRLESEAVRDGMLAISGRIDWTRGGPSFRPFVETVRNAHFYAVFDEDRPGQDRRTIYRINVNSAKSPLLETLDCPDPSTKTPKRSVTTTPLQALELMNSRFILQESQYFATRVQQEVGNAPTAQAQRAYLLALGRSPSSAELPRAMALIHNGGLDTLCWALFNTSEFLYLR